MGVLCNFDCLLLYLARSLAEIAGSYAEGDMNVCLLCVFCVVR